MMNFGKVFIGKGRDINQIAETKFVELAYGLI